MEDGGIGGGRRIGEAVPQEARRRQAMPISVIAAQYPAILSVGGAALPVEF